MLELISLHIILIRKFIHSMHFISRFFIIPLKFLVVFLIKVHSYNSFIYSLIIIGFWTCSLLVKLLVEMIPYCWCSPISNGICNASCGMSGINLLLCVDIVHRVRLTIKTPWSCYVLLSSGHHRLLHGTLTILPVIGGGFRRL